MISKNSRRWLVFIFATTMLAAIAISKEQRRHSSHTGSKLQSARLVEVSESGPPDQIMAYQIGGFKSWDEAAMEPESDGPCRWLSASFAANPPSWEYSNVSHRLASGRLEIKSTSNIYVGRTACDFNPGKFFALSMDVWKKSNNNWIGFQPFNDEGPVMQVGNAQVDGLGVALLKDGRIGLLGYDYVGQAWTVFNAKTYAAPTKLGVTYSATGIALLVNGKQVYKIKGTFTSVPDQDTLWLVVTKAGSVAQFDNICAN